MSRLPGDHSKSARHHYVTLLDIMSLKYLLWQK